MSFITNHNTKKGFTIIEAFIATVLFTIAVAATLSLLSRSIIFSNTSADRITAVYLAQEGLELVRNARTSNILAGQPWLTNLNNCITATCTVEALSNTNVTSRTQACVGTCPLIRYSPTLFLYGYTPGWSVTTPQFRRMVTIVPQVGGVNPNADEVLVTVTVTWTQKNVPYSIILKDHLFNWQ